MKISETFPSRYLKADDLQGRDVRVTMGNVELEKLGTDMKPVLYFKGKEKGLCLNKTNSNTIADAYGDDTNDWFGQEIIMFSVMTDYQGKVGPAIRVKVPPRAPVRREDPISTSPQRMTVGVSDNLTSDEVPF